MTDSRLYNCCTDYAAPDWSRFERLELAGCRNVSDTPDETRTESGFSAADAQLFTIYGRRPAPDGTCEAVTDIDDARDALAVAAELGALSGLPLIVSPTLANDERANAAPVPALVVVVEGGTVSSVCGTGALVGMPVHLIDYDTDGACREDLTRIRQRNGTFCSAYHRIEEVTPLAIPLPAEEAA